MFIEKSRGKLGKILQPDGVAFNYVVKNVSEGKLPDNITFVPITISYERIFEGETFPRVLLGEDKE
jgi:glycerol-3-phosphate O-acyltransferase